MSHVRVEEHPLPQGGAVAELVLDRPEAMNAISGAMAADLLDAARGLAAAGERGDVRAVVVTSSNERAFCVGADLKERAGLSHEGLMAQRPLLRAAYRSVLDLPVPALAAVDGYALGGGFEIALSCDLVIAAEGSTFALPEVSVGVIPGAGGTQLLTRRVGWSRAASLILTARRVDAAEAHALGVLEEVTAAGGARERAIELARTIAAHSPVGLRSAKRAMRLGADVDLGSGLEIEDACWRATAFSGDRVEGARAFVEKRPPRWPGV